MPTSTANAAATRPPVKPLSWLIQRARTARTWIMLTVAAGLVSGMLLILQARLLAAIVHGAFIDGLPRAALASVFLTLGGVVLLRAGLAWAREWTGFHAGARVRSEVRAALIDHAGRLGPAHPSLPPAGAWGAVTVEQVEALQAFFSHYLPQLVLAPAIPAAILAFVFPVSWAAGGLLLLTAPLIPVFMILVGMGAENVSQRHFQTMARMSAHFLDVLQGLPTLKLLNRSRDEARRIATTSDEYRRATLAVLRVAFLSTAVLELFSSLAIALVAVYLGSIYLGFADFGLFGRPLTLYQGLFILLLAPDFFMPLRELGTHYHARAEALGAAEEILAVMARKPARELGGSRRLATRADLTVDCRGMHVAYAADGPPVLRGIDLHLQPGERVALVGPSGAGKTTVVNLLLGFIRPDRGAIRINGIPLPDLASADWLGAVAWVGQRPILFHGTIAGNIRLARPDADHRQIADAARRAGVLEFTRHLPDGLDTPVGERGWGLSRGQAQRVALARAFVKNAPLLLLDEPTAGLDETNARHVMASVDTLAKDRTVLQVTHRLEHLRAADRVLVLDNGRIADEGRFEDLRRRPGILRGLIRAGRGDRP